MTTLSQAAEDRQQGFAELLDVSGECVTLVRADSGNEEGFKAIVNRDLETSAVDSGQINFGKRDKTRVEFLRSEVSTRPKPGDHYIDDCGEFHRVMVVRSSDISWKCDCEVGEVDE